MISIKNWKSVAVYLILAALFNLGECGKNFIIIKTNMIIMVATLNRFISCLKLEGIGTANIMS